MALAKFGTAGTHLRECVGSKKDLNVLRGGVNKKGTRTVQSEITLPDRRVRTYVSRFERPAAICGDRQTKPNSNTKAAVLPEMHACVTRYDQNAHARL